MLSNNYRYEMLIYEYWITSVPFIIKNYLLLVSFRTLVMPIDTIKIISVHFLKLRNYMKEISIKYYSEFIIFSINKK